MVVEQLKFVDCCFTQNEKF